MLDKVTHVDLKQVTYDPLIQLLQGFFDDKRARKHYYMHAAHLSDPTRLSILHPTQPDENPSFLWVLCRMVAIFFRKQRSN